MSGLLDLIIRMMGLRITPLMSSQILERNMEVATKANLLQPIHTRSIEDMIVWNSKFKWIVQDSHAAGASHTLFTFEKRLNGGEVVSCVVSRLEQHKLEV